MLHLGRFTARHCQGVTRRELLQVGACSAIGLGLGNTLQTAARASSPTAQVKRVILLWLWGGPSHHEMWDPKPRAPSKIRGPFSPIATSVSGIHIGELLPLSARMMDRFTIVRSMAHDMKDHNQGGTVSLTGSTNGSQASGGVPFPGRVRPSMGSLASYLSRREPGKWPAFTVIGPECKVSGALLRGQTSGALGAAHDPFRLESWSYDDGVRIPPSIEPLAELGGGRLDNRLQLLAEFDGWRRRAEQDGSAERFTDLKREAFSLLSSSGARQALDIDAEPDDLRDRYGRTVFGQNLVLARRLVEAGVPFVQINWSGDAEDEQQGGDGGWDLHYRLFERMQDRFCPIFDRALTALVDDLAVRGLLDSTLVIAMGEFGRSPEISSIGGREHWPFGYSVLLAGGGTPGGRVVGATTADGGHPAARPVHPADLIVTVLNKMGLDRQELFVQDSAVLGSEIGELM